MWMRYETSSSCCTVSWNDVARFRSSSSLDLLWFLSRRRSEESDAGNIDRCRVNCSRMPPSLLQPNAGLMILKKFFSLLLPLPPHLLLRVEDDSFLSLLAVQKKFAVQRKKRPNYQSTMSTCNKIVTTSEAKAPGFLPEQTAAYPIPFSGFKMCGHLSFSSSTECGITLMYDKKTKINTNLYRAMRSESLREI